MNFDGNEIARILTDSISLSLPPIAICFTDKVPAGIRNWTGRVPAGCRFWQEAATDVFATSPSDHGLCAIGMFTHNMETTEAQEATAATRSKVSQISVMFGRRTLPRFRSSSQRPEYVIYGPFASIPSTPDVVLLFGKADQMLILSEASQQVEGGLAPAMGRLPARSFRKRLIPAGRRLVWAVAGRVRTWMC